MNHNVSNSVVPTRPQRAKSASQLERVSSPPKAFGKQFKQKSNSFGNLIDEKKEHENRKQRLSVTSIASGSGGTRYKIKLENTRGRGSVSSLSGIEKLERELSNNIMSTRNHYKHAASDKDTTNTKQVVTISLAPTPIGTPRGKHAESDVYNSHNNNNDNNHNNNEKSKKHRFSFDFRHGHHEHHFQSSESVSFNRYLEVATRTTNLVILSIISSILPFISYYFGLSIYFLLFDAFLTSLSIYLTFVFSSNLYNKYICCFHRICDIFYIKCMFDICCICEVPACLMCCEKSQPLKNEMENFPAPTTPTPNNHEIQHVPHNIDTLSTHNNNNNNSDHDIHQSPTFEVEHTKPQFPQTQLNTVASVSSGGVSNASISIDAAIAEIESEHEDNHHYNSPKFKILVNEETETQSGDKIDTRPTIILKSSVTASMDHTQTPTTTQDSHNSNNSNNSNNSGVPLARTQLSLETQTASNTITTNSVPYAGVGGVGGGTSAASSARSSQIRAITALQPMSISEINESETEMVFVDVVDSGNKDETYV